MPEISRFFGLIIKMYFLDHAPPHFHAEYGNYQAVIDISNAELLSGYLPTKQLKLVQAWCIMHELELLENFSNLSSSNPTWKPIEPLK